jgi:hypothetical protein
MPDLREKFPMMPPFDPYYSVVAIHDQDLVGLSEIRIRYWFQANHLIKIDIDPYSVGL